MFSNDEEKCFHAVIQLKSLLIGSNKAKNRIIEAGVVPRLLNLLTEPSLTDLKVAVAYALGSIGNVQFFIDFMTVLYTRWRFAEYLRTRKNHEKICETLFIFKLSNADLPSI